MMEAEMIMTREQVEGLYAVAYGFLEAGRTNESLSAFRLMVRFSPLDERGWLGLASCHEELGDDEVAAELLGAGSVVAAPPSARCLIALARLRVREGDRRGAIELLDDARGIAEETDAILLRTITHELEVLS